MALSDVDPRYPIGDFMRLKPSRLTSVLERLRPWLNCPSSCAMRSMG